MSEASPLDPSQDCGGKLPGFPCVPAQRQIVDPSGSSDAYPRCVLPYCNTIMYAVASGRDFTKVKFPEDHGYQIGGGDFAPLRWVWRNPTQISIPQGSKVVVKASFHVEFDLKCLYQAFLSLGICSDVLDAAFSLFGLDSCFEPKLRDLNASFVGTGSPIGETISIPPESSISYGFPWFPSDKLAIVQAVPVLNDHTLSSKLYIISGENKAVLHEFYSGIRRVHSSHEGVMKYGNYGPFGDPIPLHSHDKKSHIAPGSLQCEIWTPKEPFKLKKEGLSLRTFGHYDNLHCEFIDATTISVLYWFRLHS